MAIKTERLSPTSLKVFDDRFGDEMHYTASQSWNGRWAVRVHYSSFASDEVADFDNAQDAVDAAASRLRDAISELDDAEATVG